MNWLSSLFSPAPSTSSRRGQAMSNTHDAFSLPTSSPTFTTTPAEYPETLNTPDTSASYSYPPQGPGTYGYTPPSAGYKSRQTSLLPLYQDPQLPSGQPGLEYTPLAATWSRIQTWLAREYPELGDTLNYGILPQDLGEIEMHFGFPLPAVVRESYLCVDGQEAESSAGCSEGLFFGLTFLPLEDVQEEWRFWREVDDDPALGANATLREGMQSIPPKWIRKEYSQRGWIPLISDKAGNYVGIDLSPDASGHAGQVIVFGRDFDTKVVLFNGDGATGWAKFLANFAEELESGEGFEVGSASDNSDDSDDDVGYESYFYDGSGRGQGDGGGDNGGGGGLRLTGEYRGWNVLEAWADRSVRKWYESGLISEGVKPSHEKRKSSLAMGFGSTDLSHGSSAEVAIPVLGSSSTSHQQHQQRSSSVSAPTPPSGASDHTAVPTISVTKPPAPLPLELPTPRDITALPSPPDSTHSSFDEGRDVRPSDLEGGMAPRRSPVAAESASRSRTTATPPLIEPDATPERLATPPPEVPDLLADSVPVIDSAPVIHPDTTTSPSVATQDLLADEEEADPDVTIRLVGGGGQSGLAEDEDQKIEEPVSEDTEAEAATGQESDAASVNSTKTPKLNKKNHKKNNSSLTSLKKFGGNLGGMRKKNSGSGSNVGSAS